MTAAADRHLLFGLLALQNGLIDQGQLVAAFQAWTRDRSKRLADLLQARGDLDDEDCAAVEALAARHLKRNDGDVEKSLAAIPADRSTRDSLADLGEPEIAATLARVARAGNGHATDVDADPDRTATLAVGAAAADGQRFRSLRPHARGGLGEVFVALDAELHREVALKQILEKHADDPVSRRRFVAEAEITGGLEHPGVVPVYGLGTYGGGRPYYAMRFIRGDSLKEAIEHFHGDEALKGDPGRRALELRKLLRRFLDVCNAIDYAHSRGVIHRDLKPANIILGRHGETLVVDWGLAKAVGRADPSVGEQTIAPSSGGSSETLPGSALGTPAYMSPEQASGDLDRLGVRSDVYSLGATLYGLLTGRPPFEGEDVGAILRRVQAGDFRAPREVDRALDRALEAVCLKAMATQPADRYSSCRALAEDIERWAADEPVSAWREPIVRRARRWANRNRTAVASAAVALLAGVVGLAAVLAVQTQARAEITRALAGERDANRALAASHDELARSTAAVQARFDLAVVAIKAFHTGVSEDFLLKQDQFKELRDRLLRSAQEFYGKLSALLGRETGPAARRALLESNFELADLTDKVGSPEDALKAHRAVLAAREALAAEPGAGTSAAVDLGRSLTAVAGLLRATGKTGEALEMYRRSESLLASLADAEAGGRAALAFCRSRLALLLVSMGRTADALAAFRQALADQESLAAAPGSPAESRSDLAYTLVQFGNLLSDTGHPTEAESEYRRALEIGEKLVAGHPAVSDFRSNLAKGHSNLGDMLSWAGRQAEAEVEYRKALGIRQKLAADNPTVTDFRAGLGIAYHNLGLLLSNMGRPTEAEPESRHAVEMFEKLVDENPKVPEYRRYLALALGCLATPLRGLGRPAEARERCERALVLHEALVRENPEVSYYRVGLAFYLLIRGQAVLAEGHSSAAAADLRRSIGRYAAEPSLNGQQRYHFACGRAMLSGLAARADSGVSAAEAMSEADAAMVLLREAIAMDFRVVGDYRTEEALDPLRDREDFRLLMMDLVFPSDAFAVTR